MKSIKGVLIRGAEKQTMFLKYFIFGVSAVEAILIFFMI